MTIENSSTRKVNTRTRKRVITPAAATATAVQAAAVAEPVARPVTFKAALAESEKAQAPARATKRKKATPATPRTLTVSREPRSSASASAKAMSEAHLAAVIREARITATAMMVSRPEPEPEPKQTAWSRSWSWLRSTCSAIYRKDAERATLAAIEKANLLPATTTKSAITREPETSTALARISDDQGNAMTRAFSWLQTKYAMSTAKRLRVTETVSLGEKRFVAVVNVDGREFLVGGGTTNVSILASLGAQGANLIPELSVEKVSE